MEIFIFVYMVLLGVNVIWALVNCFNRRKFIKANISYILGILQVCFVSPCACWG